MALKGEGQGQVINSSHSQREREFKKVKAHMQYLSTYQRQQVEEKKLASTDPENKLKYKKEKY